MIPRGQSHIEHHTLTFCPVGGGSTGVRQPAPVARCFEVEEIEVISYALLQARCGRDQAAVGGVLAAPQ